MKQPWLKVLLSLGSGILMSLAAAPLNAWWLAWIALVPFWVVVSRSQESGRSRRSLLYPLAWGFGYHGLTLSWILGLHPLTWMGLPWLASVAIAVFCWGFITLWGTAANLAWAWVMGWISRRPQREARSQKPDGVEIFRQTAIAPEVGKSFRSTLTKIWVGTALWCGLEFGLNLTPLSWTSLSFTQSPGNLVILHLGRLSGPFVVTAAIVACNGLLAEAWMQRQDNARSPLTLVAIAAGLLLSAHAIGYGLYLQPLADTPANALTLGIVQGNIPTREKLSPGGIQRAVRGYVGGYETLAAQGVDAVLTPEGSLPFLWDASRNPFYQAVVAQGVPAWLGIFVSDGESITQSLLSIASNGEIVGRYNKIKLVPLGEYIPFQATVGRWIGRLSPIKSSMVPGRTDQTFDTPFGRAIASICYESVFPELFRAQVATGGQFILTASNLDPYSEVLMAQHQAQDLMRAIETDRWAARATNTGYSGFIDPHGKVIWRSQPRVYQLHAETIYRRHTQTLYYRWGDWLTPTLLATAAMLLIFQQVKNLHP
ncbi:MAG: apolipoprotein N-acyltransferase [Leptolyngbyaceae cyanobacterium bins.349]|nr:apolipoprotein N-acyltransferase [Leptolyngbyaceae cyanobacterium bins.349]